MSHCSCSSGGRIARRRFRLNIDLLLGVVALLVMADHAHAQFERRRPARIAQPEFSLGFYGGLNTNLHSGDFSADRSVYVCERFTSGAGAGASGGLEMLYNFDPHYAVRMRLGYNNMYGAFVSERGQINLFVDSGQYIREHVWRPSLSYGTAEVLFDFSPVLRRVQFLVGPTFSYNLTKHFTQEEQILSAGTNLTSKDHKQDYKFPNGSNIWIVDQGDLPDVRKFMVGVEIGVASEFKLGKNWLLTPQGSAHFFVQDVSKAIPWSILTFKVGASVMYVFAFDD